MKIKIKSKAEQELEKALEKLAYLNRLKKRGKKKK